MNSIHFTQYMRPYGDKKPYSIERPVKIVTSAEKVIKYGGKFEAEVLRTNEVSLTVAYDDPEEGMVDIAIQVCPNGPEVRNAVDLLVCEALGWFKNKTERTS